MQLLKAELHTHAKEDKRHNLQYSVKDLIDEAARHKYHVLATTFHDKVFNGSSFKKAAAYAKGKGIVLIQGCEATIEGKHTLIYNITDRERSRIRTFRDLRKLKIAKQKAGKEILIIAPHPYFKAGVMGKYCLGRKLKKNIDIFDAIEYSFFYLKRVNRNKKAVKVAKRYCKPMVGNADVHVLENLNRTYSLIKTDNKDPSSIIRAIKEGNVKVVTKPLNVKHVVRLAYFHSFKS